MNFFVVVINVNLVWLIELLFGKCIAVGLIVARVILVILQAI